MACRRVRKFAPRPCGLHVRCNSGNSGNHGVTVSTTLCECVRKGSNPFGYRRSGPRGLGNARSYGGLNYTPMLTLNVVFCGLLLSCAALVVQSANPVYGVLSLILAFFNAGALVLLCGHDYLAALFVVLYVGAMCTFFLFAIMILDIRAGAGMEPRLAQLPVNVIVGGLGALVCKPVLSDHLSPRGPASLCGPVTPELLDPTSQIGSLGAVLYTTYGWHLIVAGLILLSAMLGSIVLTLNKSSHARSQTLSRQNLRDFRLTVTKHH